MNDGDGSADAAIRADRHGEARPAAEAPRSRTDGTVAPALAVRLALRVREAWRSRLPGRVRPVLLILAAGWLASLGATVGLTLWARSLEWLDAWDERALAGFLERSPVTLTLGTMLETAGALLVLVPLTAAVAIVLADRGRVMAGVGMLLAYHLMRPFVFIGWQVWDRPRPDAVLGGSLAPDLHSFPSGHAALSLACYGYLAWLWAAGTRSLAERVLAVGVMLAILLAVAAARLALGTHWPSDVIAGWLIAIPWLVAVIVAVRRAEAPRTRA